MVENLTAVNCNNKLYLCELSETKERVELLNACLWKDETPLNIMMRWIQKYNLGELQTVRLGIGTGYAIDPLNTKQKIQLRQLWNDMQEIKRTAIHRLENDYFVKDVK